MGRRCASADASIAPRGRPRGVATDVALAAALRIFRLKGYKGASLPVLVEAMGMPKASIYATFGDKQALYLRCLDLFEAEKLAFIADALQAGSARSVAQAMIEGTVRVQSDLSEEHGFEGMHPLTANPEATAIDARIAKRTKCILRALTKRFEAAEDAGELPGGIRARQLAVYLMALLTGLSLQISTGATPDEIQQLATMSLALWPTP